jgi:hypothetical protein
MRADEGAPLAYRDEPVPPRRRAAGSGWASKSAATASRPSIPRAPGAAERLAQLRLCPHDSEAPRSGIDQRDRLVAPGLGKTHATSSRPGSCGRRGWEAFYLGRRDQDGFGRDDGAPERLDGRRRALTVVILAGVGQLGAPLDPHVAPPLGSAFARAAERCVRPQRSEPETNRSVSPHHAGSPRSSPPSTTPSASRRGKSVSTQGFSGANPPVTTAAGRGASGRGARSDLFASPPLTARTLERSRTGICAGPRVHGVQSPGGRRRRGSALEREKEPPRGATIWTPRGTPRH